MSDGGRSKVPAKEFVAGQPVEVSKNEPLVGHQLGKQLTRPTWEEIKRGDHSTRGGK